MIRLIVGNDAYAGKNLSILLSMFNKLNEDVMHAGLKWDITLGDGIPYQKVQEFKTPPWFEEENNVSLLSSAKDIDLDAFLDGL